MKHSIVVKKLIDQLAEEDAQAFHSMVKSLESNLEKFEGYRLGQLVKVTGGSFKGMSGTITGIPLSADGLYDVECVTKGVSEHLSFAAANIKPIGHVNVTGYIRNMEFHQSLVNYSNNTPDGIELGEDDRVKLVESMEDFDGDVQYARVLREGDPVRGYFVSFIIACGCICIGELNAVAPLISMFFMIT